MTLFRAVWPIVDQRVSYEHLLTEALEELPVVTQRARARVTGVGRFSIARSVDVPGSGRVTPTVLLYEAPAEALPHRPYWPTVTTPLEATG